MYFYLLKITNKLPFLKNHLNPPLHYTHPTPNPPPPLMYSLPNPLPRQTKVTKICRYLHFNNIHFTTYFFPVKPSINLPPLLIQRPFRSLPNSAFPP